MADVYEMPYKTEEIKQSEPRSNTPVETGYIRVRVVTLIFSHVLVAVFAMFVAAIGTGILVYNTTAGDRDCNLVLPEGTSISNTVATNLQDDNINPTTTTTTPVTQSTTPVTQSTTQTQDKTTEPADNRQGPGTVYIRWGRTVCPNNTKTMYDGYTAGSHYQHSGGMVDTLCLPKQPQFLKTYAGVQSFSSIYGTEYENGATQTEALFDKPVHDHDVPCVVCEASGRLIQVMLPARTECFDGWELEYTGYLMAEHISYYRSQVKCVDKNPEVLAGQSGNTNGNLLYFIEPAGQLPNPPYIKEQELACVICTK